MKLLRAIGVSIALASLFGASHAAAATIYHMTGLGFLPNQDTSSATAISANGQVTGYSQTLNHTSPTPFVWTASGGMKPIKLPPGASDGLAWGINSLGQVVGETGDAALLATTTTARTLGFLPTAFESYARAINDSGIVVGYSPTLPPGTSSYLPTAFLWTSAGGIQNLGHSIGGAGSTAFAINAQGQIVGYASTSLGNHPVLWTVSGAFEDLDPSPQDSGQANAINSLGDVVGWTSPGGAFIWSAASGMKRIGLTPNGINDSDQVVGANLLNDGHEHAAIWTSDGGTQYLTFLMDSSGVGWKLEVANAINNSGWIVGEGIDPAGKTEAFLLRPIPEPSSLVLTVIGVSVGLVRYCRQRRCDALNSQSSDDWRRSRLAQGRFKWSLRAGVKH